MTARETRSFECLICGTELRFSAGSFSSWCPTCEDERPLPLKYPESVPQVALPGAERYTMGAVEGSLHGCGHCGAVVRSRKPTDACLFCASGQADSAESTGAPLQARGMLPMLIGPKSARAKLRQACAEIGIADETICFKPVMLPWLSVGVEISIRYKGERGDHYQDSRERTRVQWTPVEASILQPVFDAGAVASKGLPSAVARRLSNWDWPFIVSSKPRCATETIELDRGAVLPLVFPDLAQTVEQLIRSDLGGDEQRIHHRTYAFEDLRYRAVLVPVWTGKLAHLDRRFAINGRTGGVVVDTYEAQSSAGEDDLDRLFAEAEVSEARRQRVLGIAGVALFVFIIAVVVVTTFVDAL